MTAREEDAFVLQIYPYGDTDGIVVLLTRGSGKVRLMSRGLKKLKNQTHGIVAPFNRVTVHYRLKDPEQLGILTGASARQALDVASCGLEGFYFLSYLSEVILAIELDPASGERVFRLVEALCETMHQNHFSWALLCYFQFWILRLEGVLPDPDACARCGRDFHNGLAPGSFDVGHLAFKCRDCSESLSGFDPALFLVFRSFKHLSPGKVLDLPIDMPVYRELICSLASKLSDFIGKPQQSLPLLKRSLETAIT